MFIKMKSQPDYFDLCPFVVDIVIAEVVLELWQNEYESESNPKPGRSGPAYKMLMGSLLIE